MDISDLLDKELDRPEEFNEMLSQMACDIQGYDLELSFPKGGYHIDTKKSFKRPDSEGVPTYNICFVKNNSKESYGCIMNLRDVERVEILAIEFPNYEK
ncbi:hypothetical protein GOV11_01785 [Candidatus Woesearchaeota archaeon]|nr:hypothetical protein [Candidatus Woesearchaeota archaeon]